MSVQFCDFFFYYFQCFINFWFAPFCKGIGDALGTSQWLINIVLDTKSLHCKYYFPYLGMQLGWTPTKVGCNWKPFSWERKAYCRERKNYQWRRELCLIQFVVYKLMWWQVWNFMVWQIEFSRFLHINELPWRIF